MEFDQSSRRQGLVRQEDKQARIDQFLGFYLDRIFADWVDDDAQHRVTLIARSPASPVARALMDNAEDVAGAGIRLSVLFTDLEPRDELGNWFDFALSCGEADGPGDLELCHAGNAAFLDAHEQLVLGSEMSWSGDAMRRDPAVRDTVEVFDPCCDRTARQANRSFDAIRQRSKPVSICDQVRSQNARTDATDGAGGKPETVVPGEAIKPHGPSAATRH